MSIPIHDPRYGYDYLSTAVKVPCPVVGKLGAVPANWTVLGLSYSIDSGTAEDIVIPPTHHFSIPQIVADPGDHTLTIVALAYTDSGYNIDISTTPFTVTGAEGYQDFYTAASSLALLTALNKAAPLKPVPEIADSFKLKVEPRKKATSDLEGFTFTLIGFTFKYDGGEAKGVEYRLLPATTMQDTEVRPRFRPTQKVKANMEVVAPVMFPKDGRPYFAQFVLWDPTLLDQYKKKIDDMGEAEAKKYYIPFKYYGRIEKFPLND